MNQHDSKSHQKHSGNIIWGAILIGLGLLFLLMNLGMLPDLGDMWPAVIIIVGLALIIGAFCKRNAVEQPHGEYPGQQ